MELDDPSPSQQLHEVSLGFVTKRQSVEPGHMSARFAGLRAQEHDALKVSAGFLVISLTSRGHETFHMI
jgi:hypothetical protein